MSDEPLFHCVCRAKTPLFFDEKGLVECPDCGRQWKVNKEGTGMSPAPEVLEE